MAWGTPTDIGNAHSSGSSFVGKNGVTVPAGSLIVILVHENNGTGSIAGTVTDTASNTYHLAGSIEGFGGHFFQIFYAYNVNALSSQSINYASHYASFLLVDIEIVGMYVSGEKTISDPFDSSSFATASAATSSPSVTSGTPAATGELFVGATVLIGATPTLTQSSGWSAPPNEYKLTSVVDILCGTKVNAGGSAQTYNPTSPGSYEFLTLIASFKAPSSSAGFNMPMLGM
jgi:hypothetical protein